MLKTIRRLCLIGVLLCAPLFALLYATPAHAVNDGGNHADTCAPGCTDVFAPYDKNGNSVDTGFYQGGEFMTTNNRLANEQTGDRGYSWAVAGDKDWCAPTGTYNADLPASYVQETNEHCTSSTPSGPNEQWFNMLDDLEDVCAKGNHAGGCAYDRINYPAWTYNEILYSYYSNALNYRTGNWGGFVAGGTNVRWTIYLQSSNGGIDWSDSSKTNYGQVATVGELRAFLLDQIAKGEGSETYRYNLGRAVVYLDYVYGTDYNHPIEFLTIPNNWWYVCLTPRLNADGSLFTYYGGALQMDVYEPVIFASSLAHTAEERYLSCPPLDDGHWEYAYESEIGGDGSQENTDITAPYAVWTEVTDDSPSGVGKYPFVNQREYKLTPFGQKLQELCAARGEEACAADIEFTDAEMAELRQAANASEGATGPKIDLTSGNKQSLAEGRLLTVDQRSQYATVSKHSERDRYMRRWMKTSTYYDDSGNVVDVRTTQGEWEYANEPDKDISRGEATFTVGTPRWDAGYQIIVNHCNGTAFDNAVGAYSIDNREVTDKTFTGSYVAGSAVSPAYTDPADKPWGEEGPTADVGFYDKVCSYEGTRTDPDTEKPTSATVNGYTKSFRDNAYHYLPTSYFTPTSDGWVTYNGDGPVAFTATRWEEGTPKAGQFWIGGKDCRTGQFSDGYFGTSDRDAPTLKQWTLTAFSSSDVAMVPGCYKNVFTRAIWASERAKPQVLTMKWDFAPEVATVVPDHIGFTSGLDASYEKETVGAEVRGQVVSSNAQGDDTVPAHQDAYVEATGSGTTNTLDEAVPYGVALDVEGKWTVQPDLYSPYYYAVSLVRTVGS